MYPALGEIMGGGSFSVFQGSIILCEGRGNWRRNKRREEDGRERVLREKLCEKGGVGPEVRMAPQNSKIFGVLCAPYSQPPHLQKVICTPDIA